MKLIIVEASRAYRDLLADKCQEDFEVLAVVASAEEGLQVIERTPADLLLLDLSQRLYDLQVIAERFLQFQPSLGIIGIARETNYYTLYRVYESPLRGYVCKEHDGVLTVTEALKRVSKGESYFSEAAEALKREMQSKPNTFYKLLSRREMQLLPDLCAGRTNEDIAQRMGLQASTVLWHRRNIMRKLGVHATTDLMRLGVSYGVIQPEVFDDFSDSWACSPTGEC